MTKWIKNEPNATHRQCTIFVYLPDGVTPAPAATSWTAVQASRVLTGTHAATITWSTGGSTRNGATISLAADGTGAGSLTSAGSAYTFHYQTGVTTMANFVTAGAALFAFSGHTPANVLVSPGDTQGPLAFAGGLDFPIKLRSGVTYSAGLGTLVSTGVDGEWVYTATQPEANQDTNEIVVFFDRGTSYYSPRTFVEVDDGSISSTMLANIWEGISLEGSMTPGDMIRQLAAWTFGPLSDFRTTTQTAKSLDGSKTRGTVVVSAAGRDSFTEGDSTP